VKSRQKFPQCLTEPVPAGSKTDSPLAKAEPISDSGRTSVAAYIRRKENTYIRAFAAGERRTNV